jgi:hypothetical protein
LGHGNWLGGVGAGFQSLVLLLPIVGIALTFGRLFSRLGKGGWSKTEGKPFARAAFVLAGVALIGGLAYVWAPNGDYEPIRKGEKGTLAEGVHTITHVGSGRSSLISRDRAKARGDLGTTPVTTTDPASTRDQQTPAQETTTTWSSGARTATSLRSSASTSTTIDRSSTGATTP